jgi:hypothetical protein
LLPEDKNGPAGYRKYRYFKAGQRLTAKVLVTLIQVQTQQCEMIDLMTKIARVSLGIQLESKFRLKPMLLKYLGSCRSTPV